MSLLDTFRLADEMQPFETINENMPPNQQTAEWDRPADDPHVWLDRYAQFSERPRFNPNIDGYISPYANGHWGASSDIMQALASQVELGPMQERMDPNKIFTSDIAALRTLAADQIKIVRVFERKLLESLNDKGKFGLNEDDIEAMQALTSARSAITQINKEQIAIKKSIAELKLKQQQAGQAGGPAGAAPSRPANAFDVGRSIMDTIFETPTPPANETIVVPNYQPIDPEEAASVLNGIVGDAQSLSPTIMYENDNPTTYVVVSDEDDGSKPEFVTLSSSGEILKDYPTPDVDMSKLTIDRVAKNAQDDLMQSYPVKFRSQLQ
jgi:hypothetical protein